MTTSLPSKAEQLAKNAENLPSIFGAVNILSIRQNVEEVLKLIGRDGIFREYTLHDVNHIDALLALVEKLIIPETQHRMKTADWLQIVLSCYFHDLGMLVTRREFEDRNDGTAFPDFKKEILSGDKGRDYKSALERLTDAERDEFLYQEFVRHHHAKRIYHWIQGQDARHYGAATAAVTTINELLSSLAPVVRDDLAKICLSHHEDDLYDLQKYRVNRVYGDDPSAEVNLHFAAIILRSADVLQIQRQRVPPVLYKLIDPSNPKSQEEWAKQAGVRAVKPTYPAANIDPDTIEVHASFEKESAYFGLLAYVQQYAAKEIERCHRWAADAEKVGSKYRFPWRRIDTSQVEPRGFEGRTYGFKLDQEKILTLLTGHTLYNDSRVAVREVLQNALDAVRFRKHQNPSEPIGEIHVTWNTNTRRLSVRDTGTGMTQETIEGFLLNVGASYYQSETVRTKYADFSPISRFGIGILSTFMIADEVQILTVHPDDEYARQLTLPSVVRSYLVKKFAKGDPAVRYIGSHGTDVTLQVRRSATVRNIEALVRYWMVIPGCRVTCSVDASPATDIGFTDARAAIDYYQREAFRGNSLVGERQIDQVEEMGIQLAHLTGKSKYVDTWEFVRETRSSAREVEREVQTPPGVCVEGIRVRSAPLGYASREGSPWVLANLTGRDAPRTNVARSDLEETPELERFIARVFGLLGNHAVSEFNRLIGKGSGITEAAREAEIIVNYGLSSGPVTSFRLLDVATADLRIVAIEDSSACRAASRTEVESLGEVWTVESRLLENVEWICGSLGLSVPVEAAVEKLGGGLAVRGFSPRRPAYPLESGGRGATLQL